jgi:hypothetical protein
MTPGSLVRDIVLDEFRSAVMEAVRDFMAARPPSPVRLRPMPRFSSYRGDSRAKKAVRLRVWEAVRDSLGEALFVGGPHLFLCSREGGDASVLRGLGVPDASMIAVDSDPSAAVLFCESYPGVTVTVSDVGNVLPLLPAPLSSAYLDFTSHVSPATLQRVLLAARAVRPGGVVACTFASGRERGRARAAAGACESRLDAVESYLSENLGYRPAVMARMSYISESEEGRGSNMCVLVFRTSPGGGRLPRILRVRAYDLYRDVQRHLDSPSLGLLLNCADAQTAIIRDRVVAYPPERKS